MVLDRVNRKAYCARSTRSDEALFIEFCEDFEYSPIVFDAYLKPENKEQAIYHTNVMMSVGKDIAIVCLESIADKTLRKQVAKQLTGDKKTIIDISITQLKAFAGNVIQIKTKDSTCFVMSTTAYNSFTDKQLELISKDNTILKVNIETIEQFGGGSVRCMINEVFLPKR